jgi:hypothetical protein
MLAIFGVFAFLVAAWGLAGRVGEWFAPPEVDWRPTAREEYGRERQLEDY